MEQVFKKRAGTTDRGRDYEHLYIANSVLKLIDDDTIEDFSLSSNDEKYGAFDDIVIEIKYWRQTQTEIYAIQLKQSKSKILRVKNLTAPRGDFSIRKYFQDYTENLETFQKSVRRIIFTNCSIQMPDTIQLSFDDEKFLDVDVSKTTPDDLVASETGLCYIFNAKCKNNFFDNFFLYTSQDSVHQMEVRTVNRFKSLFGSNESVVKDYLLFITEWSKTEGKKEKLSKEWMKRLIATHVLSPFIKPLSFSTGLEVTQREKTFIKAVSLCFVTRLDSDNFDNIQTIWRQVLDKLDDFSKINKVRLKYQIQSEPIRTKDDLRKESESINKLMWLLGKCPLVVTGCPEVYKGIKLCLSGNFVVLCSSQSRNFHHFRKNFTNKRFFQTLSDLPKDLYDQVLQNFTFSLEGQREASWKSLLQWNPKLEAFITTDKLVQMINRPLVVGKQKELLPPCHIPRTLTKTVIDSKFLASCDNSLVVVSHVENINAFKEEFDNVPATVVDNSDMFPGVFKENVIYINSDEVTEDQFDKLCSQFQNLRTHHHFRFINENSFEWIRSRGGVEQLRKYKQMEYGNNNFIHESSLFVNSENINIVCANSGMGKSTLMKSLKTTTPSTLWTILIYARNHTLYFRGGDRNVDDFKKYILNNFGEYEGLDKQICQTLLERNQLQIIWDGLDEVSDECLVAVLQVVEKISKTPIKQWITSRSHLRKILESKFNTFSRDINQLCGKDQRVYVKTRLSLSNIELTDIFQKIERNIAQFSNNNILGIPLQISMLVELLLRNKEKFSGLLNYSFTIVDLYENFIEEKFKIYFEDKTRHDLKTEKHLLEYGEEKRKRIDFYKKAAFGLHLESKFLKKFKSTFHRLFGNNCLLDKIKTKGDEIGLISTISQNDDPEFIHNSYGEYFAALFLFQNDPTITKDKKFFSDKKSDNVRFFLDTMLSKNSKAHVAVLYKNCTLLDTCTEEDLKCKDLVGRGVLQLALAWVSNYSLRKNNYVRINVTVKKPQDKNIVKIFDTIKDSVSTCEKKLLLLLPFLIPIYNDFGFETEVIFCAVRFDYDVFVQAYLKEVTFTGPVEDLFHTAVKFGSKKCINLFITHAELLENVDNILKLCTFELEDIFQDVTSFLRISTTKLLQFACDRRQAPAARFLIAKGTSVNAPFSDGRLPIHHALEKNFLLMAKLLIDKDAKLDVPDANGRLPIHYACEGQNLKMVKLLVEKNSRLDAVDASGQLPIHYACEGWVVGIVEFLIEKGSRLDVPDGSGRLPIHFACDRWPLEIVELLIEKNPNWEVADASGRFPIHYACERGNFTIVRLLIENGCKLDVGDVRGRLPIHCACEKGDIDKVMLLVAQNPNLDIADKDGRFPIHYACTNGDHGFEIILFLMEHKVNLDVYDVKGRSPMHYACGKGSPQLVKLLIGLDKNWDTSDARGLFPIHYACNNWNSETVQLLVENSCILTTPDTSGRFPIHHACEKEDTPVIVSLINKNINLDVADVDDRLPIHYACEKENVEIVKLLLLVGARVDIPDASGRLPIHHACNGFTLEIVKLLIDKKSKLDVPDARGRLPIHQACERGYIPIVKLLIEQGSRLDVFDASGRLPIHYACERRKLQIVKLLIDRNPGGDFPDAKGRPLIDYACERKFPEITQLLIDKYSGEFPDANGRFPIHRACEKWPLQIVKLLIDKNPTDVPDVKGRLPIHYACESGALKIVELLIGKNQKLDVADGCGRLPIHYACARGNFGIVQLLVDKEPNLDVADGNGRLPIHDACDKGNVGIVKLLIGKKSKLGQSDASGRLPLHYACARGNLEMVKLLVRSFEVNVADGDNRLPIHHACARGTLEIVNLLIGYNSTLDFSDASGQLPIHYACRRWNFAMVRLLVDKNSKLDVADGSGRLPIHHACEAGTFDAVKLLVDKKSPVDVVDASGRLPIHYACEKNSFEIVKLLVGINPNLDVADAGGFLPIHLACRRWNFNIVQLLVAKNSKLNKPDASGRLPLHYACERQNLEMVKLLVYKNAKVDVVDGKGRLPIHYACEKGTAEVVKLLLESNARLDVADADGRFPIHCACSNEFFGFEIVELLVRRNVELDVRDGLGQLPVDCARKNVVWGKKIEKLVENL